LATRRSPPQRLCNVVSTFVSLRRYPEWSEKLKIIAASLNERSKMAAAGRSSSPSRDKEREEMLRKVGQMEDLEREIVEAVKSKGFDLVSTQQKAGTLRKLIEEVDFKMLNCQNMGVPDHLNDNTEWVHICDSLYGNYLAASRYLERASGEENWIILLTINLYELKTANKTPVKLCRRNQKVASFP
jgi:hypothetical protein